MKTGGKVYRKQTIKSLIQILMISPKPFTMVLADEANISDERKGE